MWLGSFSMKADLIHKQRERLIQIQATRPLASDRCILLPCRMWEVLHKHRLQSPAEQARAAVAYFKSKLDKYDGNIDMAGMAYNQGDNPVKWDPAYTLAARKAGGLPIPPNFRDFAQQLFTQQNAVKNASLGQDSRLSVEFFSQHAE